MCIRFYVSLSEYVCHTKFYIFYLIYKNHRTHNLIQKDRYTYILMYNKSRKVFPRVNYV